MKKIGTLSIIISLLFGSCSDDHRTNAFPQGIISTTLVDSPFAKEIVNSQTPINIDTSSTSALQGSDLVINYGNFTLSKVVNNGGGKNLKVYAQNTDATNQYVTLANKKYYLKEFHFHYG